MDRSELQALTNPFAALCPELLKRSKIESRWEQREKNVKKTKRNKYGLKFGWRVLTTRNKQRDILQVSAFYRGEFAFHLLDILPSPKGFAIRLSETQSRKHGEYATEREAVTAGKLWLEKNHTYARQLEKKHRLDKT